MTYTDMFHQSIPDGPIEVTTEWLSENPNDYHSEDAGGLTEDERTELQETFNWSPQGIGDYGAAMRHPWHALSFREDATTAGNAVRGLNIPGCSPGVDYSPATAAHNDCRDAFRHTYWNALMAQSSEGAAQRQADAHERSSANPYNEHYMDLFNNRVGREIGDAHPNATHQELMDLVGQRLAAGGLITSSSSSPSPNPNPEPSYSEQVQEYATDAQQNAQQNYDNFKNNLERGTGPF